MTCVDTNPGEPHLDELLADPIVQLLMRRDGVRRRDVKELIDNLDLGAARLRLTLTDEFTVPREAARPGRA